MNEHQQSTDVNRGGLLAGLLRGVQTSVILVLFLLFAGGTLLLAIPRLQSSAEIDEANDIGMQGLVQASLAHPEVEVTRRDVVLTTRNCGGEIRLAHNGMVPSYLRVVDGMVLVRVSSIPEQWVPPSHQLYANLICEAG